MGEIVLSRFSSAYEPRALESLKGCASRTDPFVMIRQKKPDLKVEVRLEKPVLCRSVTQVASNLRRRRACQPAAVAADQTKAWLPSILLGAGCRSSRSRGGSRSGRSLSRGGRSRTRATAAATTTIATAVATMATTVATLAAMATVATTAAVATSVATAAITAAAVASATARAAVATMVTETSVSLLLAAQQGNTDNRDENRDAQNQRAIHLRILLQGTGT